MVEILKADPLLHSSRDLSYLFIKSGCAEYSNFKSKHMRELLKTSMKNNFLCPVENNTNFFIDQHNL